MNNSTSRSGPQFLPSPYGNYGLFGLKMLGTSSIIHVRGVGLDGQIWTFKSFPGPFDYIATYTNEAGEQHTFDFNDPHIYDNTMRLETLDNPVFHIL